MAAIHDLLNQITDPKLRERITREWEAATRHKKFGLVFEQHLPEVVPIYSAKPRKGDLVAKRSGSLNETWRVRRIEGGTAHLMKPRQAGEKESAGERLTLPVAELVVVKQFGDPIFPTLVPMDAVQNGLADAPWHTLIEADNYHALQLLEYLYAGKVDCVYIDPPYNSGARDWKYNNDYVDGNDGWRHSKWLSFMEKRLEIAKRILNPKASVLIVTIDEKEHVRLGLLLEQVFPNCKIQETTIVINPKGTARYNEFARVEEYAFFVFIGDIRLSPGNSDMLTARDYASETHVRWRGLARTGRKGLRSNNPGSWYPIFLNNEDNTIHSIGDAIGTSESEASVPTPDGTFAVWPSSKNGNQYSWSTVPETLRAIHERGGFKTGRVNPKRKSYPFYYLSTGLFKKIESGEIVITGRGDRDELLVEYATGLKSAMPRSVWNKVTHDAGSHGTAVLQSILPGASFPFPKSLYAVSDSIGFFVGKKKDALIVDFFAGSGTTLHATLLLNARDKGNRRVVLVTNNEVSGDESDALRADGHEPGSNTWERKGICRSVTWPRLSCAVNGKRLDGTPLPGEYLTGIMVDREKRRTFRHPAFVAPEEFRVPADLSPADLKKAEKAVEKKKLAFVSMIDALPQNSVTPSCRFIVSEDHKASVLFDPDAAAEWLEALEEQDHITDFYIVAEDEKQFKALKAQVDDLLGPLIVQEEEKRPMSAGFPSNVAYFKLDFLDKDRVELGAAFREILPLLWMKSGAIGPSPTLPVGPLPDFFVPEASPFAVLLNETRVTAFREALLAREALRHVYVVTDAEEAFRAISWELRSTLTARNPDVEFVQLYRDYLVNFTINTRAEDAAAGIGGVA